MAKKEDSIVTELFLEKRGIVCDDFTEFAHQPIMNLAGCGQGTRQMYDRFAPFVESVKWSDPNVGILGPKRERDMYLDSYKALTAAMLMNLAKVPVNVLQKEATLTGSDVPTFTKQLIRTVLRAYPRLITPQLFPVVPLNAPDGRIYFELNKYNTYFSNAAGPVISDGSVTADLTKFNSAYFKQNSQLENLNLIKIDLSNFIVVSAETYGVAAESSLQAEEDMQSIYGENYNTKISERMAYHLSWVIDRIMIDTAILNVPAANRVTWKRTPTINSVAWAAQAPTEREAWRNTIWREGILPVRTAIFTQQYVLPNWMVVGTNVAQDIEGCSMFKPVREDTTVISMRQGAIRDLGTMDGGSMRVLVDPQMNANYCLIGYRPQAEMEPAITFCPYRPIGFANDLWDPKSLKHTKGAYTRFAIGDPDPTNNESQRLGCVYGLLTVSDAA